MMLYSGSHDELADPKDVQNLIDTLDGIIESLYWKEVRKFAHLDFGLFSLSPETPYSHSIS